MIVNSHENVIEVEGLTNFHPQHIFECGQAFRWNWDGKGYIGVVADKVVRIVWDDKVLFIENANLDDFFTIWLDYFDIETDYGEITNVLSEDPMVREAIKYGWGIRILKQDPWEALVSFIISANNGIKRIKTIIERLSCRFGKEVLWQGQKYYTFPDIDALADADQAELKDCGCGYRGPYIKETAKLIREGQVDLSLLKTMSYKEAQKQLLKCPGVGPKVADCVLLFSLDKSQAFPIDVWVKRIMETLYADELRYSNGIRSFAEDRFGVYAGYAQQYLFYYAREMKIGK